MVMQKYKKIILLLSVVHLSSLTVFCTGDPWPEPDTMDPPDSDNDANGPAFDTDSDIGIDAGPGEDDDTESVDSDSACEYDSDNADSIDKKEELESLKNHVFFSAISEDGLVTLAGLAGAIPEGRSAQCLVSGEVYEILPGVERGFALRVSAKPEDDISIVVKDAGGSLITVLTVDATTSESQISWSGLIGDAEGATTWNSSYISVFGEAETLKADTLIIGADITRSSAAATPVLCTDDSCMFELLLYGELGDDVDLFQSPSTSNQGGITVTLP